MSLAKHLSRASAIAVVASLSILGSMAANGSAGAAAGIRISNFGKVNDQIYRGAQPSGGDYADLAKLGVKTVVDLRDDGEAQEPGLVKSAGMNFVRIPMSGWERPSDAAVAQFLGIANGAANLPMYVHCKVGKHRTGAMVAVYRMTREGWTAAQAYSEMQKYHFDVLLTPHTDLKTFVFDYFKQLQNASSAKQPVSR